jgi:transcriptional regulator with XRE-family HTH domain
VIARRFRDVMKAKRITKSEMAKRMRTSRSALDRLLDEDDTGLTIDTLSRAAWALGCRVRFELVA